MEDAIAQLAAEVSDLKMLVLVTVIGVGTVLIVLLVMLVIAVRTNKLAYERTE